MVFKGQAMTLDEAFEKYDDSVKIRRHSCKDRFKDCDPARIEEALKDGAGAHDIKWLKGLKSWGNEEFRKLGFFIPQFMIDDAEADDWEIYE